MDTLIILGLTAAIILTAVGHLVTPPAQSPLIMYVQAAPEEAPGGAGCLPLLILVGVILLAIALG